MYMQYLYNGNCGRESHKPSPFQINEKCASLGEMNSFGKQEAKMPWGVAMGYSFIRAFAEQMEGS